MIQSTHVNFNIFFKLNITGMDTEHVGCGAPEGIKGMNRICRESHNEKQMTEYRRAAVEGGTYFFTVNCAERRNNTLLTDNVELLKQVIRKVKSLSF